MLCEVGDAKEAVSTKSSRRERPERKCCKGRVVGSCDGKPGVSKWDHE
jgi:hypothetical protein